MTNIDTIMIEVKTGGFLLLLSSDTDRDFRAEEVFVSPRKLLQRVKQLVDDNGLVADK
jgi:hypothetical protein